MTEYQKKKIILEKLYCLCPKKDTKKAHTSKLNLLHMASRDIANKSVTKSIF